MKTDSLFYGNRLYTALYEKINPVSAEAKSFLTLEDYQKESDDNKQKGRQLNHQAQKLRGR